MKIFKLNPIPVPAMGKAELQKEKTGLTMSVLRIKSLSLVLAVLLLVGLGAFASSAMATNSKSFPIMLNRSKLATASISLSESPEFSDPTVHLDAPVFDGFSNISAFDIPADVDGDHCGSHNGPNYIAYTYYLENSTEVSCNMLERMNILYVGNHADAAVRVRVYRNGVETNYAKAGADGFPELGTVPFSDSETVFSEISALAAGEQRKYTIVIWLEGDDPDCTDAIKGGFVRFSMDFEVADQ